MTEEQWRPGMFAERHARQIAEGSIPDSEVRDSWLDLGRRLDELAEGGVRPFLSDDAAEALERGERRLSPSEYDVLNLAHEAQVLTEREKKIYSTATERGSVDEWGLPVLAEDESAVGPLNVDTVDAIVRANAGDDGISVGEAAAVQGALDTEARKETQTVRSAAAQRLRGTAQRLERLADRLERSNHGAETTATQRAAYAYSEGRNRYEHQHDSPAMK